MVSVFRIASDWTVISIVFSAPVAVSTHVTDTQLGSAGLGW